MNEDETTEVLEDLREQVELLPRFNADNTGVYQDSQTGLYVLRDGVLGLFAMYLGGHDAD
jgi:hypothetical protein